MGIIQLGRLERQLIRVEVALDAMYSVARASETDYSHAIESLKREQDELLEQIQEQILQEEVTE